MTIVWVVVASIVVASNALAVGTVVAGLCPGRIVAYSQLLILPTTLLSFAAAVVGLATGHVVVGTAATVTGGAALVMIAPKMLPSRRATAGAGPRIRVVLANLYLDNPEADDAFRQLLDRRPDVIVMTELTDELLAAFDRLASGRYDARVHRTPLRGEYEAGIFVRSGVTLLDRTVNETGALRTVEATLRVDDRQLLVIAAHPTAPEDRATFAEWTHQLRSLRDRMRRVDGAAIVLGDLNAGTLQAPYENLARRTLFRDAHAEAGRALLPSWGVLPSLPRWVPTFVARLDHLLVTPPVVVVELTDLDPVGSDHRPFEAELIVGPAGTA